MCAPSKYRFVVRSLYGNCLSTWCACAARRFVVHATFFFFVAFDVEKVHFSFAEIARLFFFSCVLLRLLPSQLVHIRVPIYYSGPNNIGGYVSCFSNVLVSFRCVRGVPTVHITYTLHRFEIDFLVDGQFNFRIRTERKVFFSGLFYFLHFPVRWREECSFLQLSFACV